MVSQLMSASPTELEFGYSYLMSHNSDVTLSIDCRFGYERCVGSLSVDVTSGDFIAITGPNGSGKSTIISTIAGELEPLGGFVRVLHREGSFLVDTSSPAAAGCVSRIAEPSFFPDLTLGEHMEIIARRSGIDLDTLLDRVSPWEIVDLPKTLPNRLSSGQRQRANLGIQLAVAPLVVVLDEPERHLDSRWTQVLCRQLRQMTQGGTAVIIASHSSALIEAADKEIRL